VVAAEIGDGDSSDELVIDYGGLGVWLYDVSQGW